MAVTGDIFKGLSFNGTSSKDYGVYITGEAVFNAPERNVEMIDIPGRNGAYALDHGNFQNIEVSYPAGIFADNEADFAQAISDFRNFLCSKKGYCRLEDDYNTGEYREAVYKSGLEVTPALLKAGEFVITFDCKPQRFLTSGETAVALTSGDTITNPTLFDSRPLIELWGYGNIEVGGQTINISNNPVGRVTLIEGVTMYEGKALPYEMSFNGGLLETGDTVYYSSSYPNIFYKNGSNQYDITGASFSNTTQTGGGTFAGYTDWAPAVDQEYVIYLAATALSFTYGSAGWVQIATDITVTGTYNGTSFTDTYTVTAKISYDGENTITATVTGDTMPFATPSMYYGNLVARSTAQISGSPLYIDCDTGAVYKIVNSTVSNYGAYVALGSELPTLSSGANTITSNNTFTKVEIVPRWWVV